MQEYTDEEILIFLAQQEKNFALTARGSGYNAHMARKQLETINGLSDEKKIELGRQQLVKFNQP